MKTVKKVYSQRRRESPDGLALLTLLSLFFLFNEGVAAAGRRSAAIRAMTT